MQLHTIGVKGNRGLFHMFFHRAKFSITMEMPDGLWATWEWEWPEDPGIDGAAARAMAAVQAYCVIEDVHPNEADREKVTSFRRTIHKFAATTKGEML